MEYGFIDINKEVDEKAWVYDEEELKLCIDFLDTTWRNINFKKVKSYLKKDLDFVKLLKIEDTEGHSLVLINMILGVNEYILKRSGWLLAMAHDDNKFTKMHDYRKFCDKFMIPTILQLICFNV